MKAFKSIGFKGIVGGSFSSGLKIRKNTVIAAAPFGKCQNIVHMRVDIGRQKLQVGLSCMELVIMEIFGGHGVSQCGHAYSDSKHDSDSNYKKAASEGTQKNMFHNGDNSFLLLPEKGAGCLDFITKGSIAQIKRKRMTIP